MAEIDRLAKVLSDLDAIELGEPKHDIYYHELTVRAVLKELRDMAEESQKESPNTSYAVKWYIEQILE